MRRRLGYTQPLHDSADPEEWGDALPEWQRRESSNAAAQARDALGNEVRWGDVFRTVVDIPATSVDGVAGQLRQIIDIRAPARSWTMAFSLTWQNILQADPGDTLVAEFIYEIGVGAARAVFFNGVTIPAMSPININSVVIPPFPAATIVVSGRLQIVPVSGAARQYSGTLAAIAAPVTR